MYCIVLWYCAHLHLLTDRRAIRSGFSNELLRGRGARRRCRSTIRIAESRRIDGPARGARILCNRHHCYYDILAWLPIVFGRRRSSFSLLQLMERGQAGIDSLTRGQRGSTHNDVTRRNRCSNLQLRTREFQSFNRISSSILCNRFIHSNSVFSLHLAYRIEFHLVANNVRLLQEMAFSRFDCCTFDDSKLFINS